VLPGWKAPAVAAWAVFPGRRLMPARTRAFLDTLQADSQVQKCAWSRRRRPTAQEGQSKRPEGSFGKIESRSQPDELTALQLQPDAPHEKRGANAAQAQ